MVDVNEGGLKILPFGGSWRVVLRCISVHSKWAINHIQGLPHYAKGNVAIIGDVAKMFSCLCIIMLISKIGACEDDSPRRRRCSSDRGKVLL